MTPDEQEKQLARTLRTIRLNEGLTQVEVAERAGINRVTLGKIESGEQALRASHLYGIADALGRVLRIRFDKPRNHVK